MSYDNAANRDLRMYIPENSRYSQPTLYLMVPSNSSPYAGKLDMSRVYASGQSAGGKSICTESEGKFNKYILKTANGVPMFTGLEVIGLSHATVPTQCTFAWNTMSHFSKNPVTKALYYDGTAVDTPVTSGK